MRPARSPMRWTPSEQAIWQKRRKTAPVRITRIKLEVS